MSDTKLADLTALTAPSGDDLLYVVDDPAGTPSDKKLALDNLFTRGTITTSSPVIDAAQTWNDAGVTFTGLKFNATDTASAAGSLLMDLQVGGASRFRVGKTGETFFKGSSGGSIKIDAFGSLAAQAFYVQNTANSTNYVLINTSGCTIAGNLSLSFTSASNSISGSDLFLTRRGAANLRFGVADAAAPVAQTLSVQSGTAGASALTVSISGTALTIAGAITGTIAIGHAVTGTGVSAGTLITAGSGSSWTVNNSQTVGPITAYFNSVGQNLTITGSQGSGPSAGGSIIFQVAPAGSAATTAQNALATALTIDHLGSFFVAANANSSVSSGAGFSSLSTTDFSVYTAGARRFAFSGTGLAFLGSSPRVALQSNTVPVLSFGASEDVVLTRDDADKLAQRRGANAQAFRLYNTFTNATDNFERANIFWDTNVLKIGTEKGSVGGTARALEFQTDGTTRLTIADTGYLLATLAGNAGSNTQTAGNLILRNTNASQSSGSGGSLRIVYDPANVISSGRLGVVLFAGARNSAGNVIDGAAIEATPTQTWTNGVRYGAQLVFTTISSDATALTTKLTIGDTVAVADAINVSVGTTTGTKVGTGTTQKIGFWNATPVVQPTAVADATDAATVITQLNALLAHMRTIGLIAT